jgi:hypothetical protein
VDRDLGLDGGDSGVDCWRYVAKLTAGESWKECRVVEVLVDGICHESHEGVVLCKAAAGVGGSE